MIAHMTTPILIVDDYNIMVRIVRNLLRQLGFANVDEASDGQAALAKMRARPYGLVISNWQAGAMSGRELVREVRADARLKHTPMLMMTPAEGAQGCAREADVSGFLPKPFDAAQLHRQLIAALTFQRVAA